LVQISTKLPANVTEIYRGSVSQGERRGNNNTPHSSALPNHYPFFRRYI